MEPDALNEMAICLKQNGSNAKMYLMFLSFKNGNICYYENVSEYDKEMPQSQTTDQPTASQGILTVTGHN